MSVTEPEAAFTFLSQGALIQEFKVAGHNIVQSLPEARFYKSHNDAYLGETIGRTTNRVKGAILENLSMARTTSLLSMTAIIQIPCTAASKDGESKTSRDPDR